MLTHIRNLIASLAATIIIYTITHTTVPELGLDDWDNWDLEDDYWENEYEPLPATYLIHEADYIDDLL